MDLIDDGPDDDREREAREAERNGGAFLTSASYRAEGLAVLPSLRGHVQPGGERGEFLKEDHAHDAE